MKKTLFLFPLFFLSMGWVNAQPVNDAPTKKKKNYTSVGVEGSLLQFARLNTNDKVIPRYTYFFNMGVDYNHRLDKTVSIFTGIHLKNLGLIQVANVPANTINGNLLPFDIKTKERVYTLGAPIGVRVYSRNRKTEMKLGMDCSVALNYKYKQFWDKSKVDKYNEWFSSEAAILHYSVFAGINIHGVSVTANYYLNNFYGRESALVANLFTLGLGIQLDKEDVSVNGRKLGDK
jgi:hypothetical protein